MHTNLSVLDSYGVSVSEIEFPDLEIPILTGAQRQGDVLVVPVTGSHPGVPIGEGVTVVRAETNTANTHTLVGDGLWLANPNASVDDLIEGWLTVPDGGEAFLIHTQEHNALGVGAGTYEVRRQREFAGVWMMVAD